MFNLLATKPFDFSAIFGNFARRWYYYLALIVAIGLVIVFAFFKKQNRNSLTRTQKLAYTAVLTAMAVVANLPIFTIKVGDILQVSFVATVGFLAGYLLGAGLGFTVAFIGDLLCAIIAPQGAYSPIINLGTALWGFISGVMFTCFKGNEIVKTIICFVLGFFLNSFVVNTWGLALMYGMNFNELLIVLPLKFVVVAINCAFTIALVQVLVRVLPKDKFTFVKNSTKSE